METMHKCIFCLREGDIFHTIEHTIPESLGNTTDILVGSVCDQCQNYFGKEIENYVLSKTPFGFWRTMAGTKNKKGKSPSYNPSQNPKDRGKLPDFHPATDCGFVIHPADTESVIEVECDNRELINKIIGEQKTDFKVVLTPKALVYMGRFLGKLALEYWCKNFENDVFRKDFDDLRKYCRNGTTTAMWPIMHGILKENLLKYEPINSFEEEHTLYAYRFIEENGIIVFSFDIGTERYSMILNQKCPPGSIFTEELLSAICNGTVGLPNILFYHL